MDITVDISKETIQDMDSIIGQFVSKFANEVVSVEALAVCLQTLIDKRNEIQNILEEQDMLEKKEEVCNESPFNSI